MAVVGACLPTMCPSSSDYATLGSQRLSAEGQISSLPEKVQRAYGKQSVQTGKPLTRNVANKSCGSQTLLSTTYSVRLQSGLIERLCQSQKPSTSSLSELSVLRIRSQCTSLSQHTEATEFWRPLSRNLVQFFADFIITLNLTNKTTLVCYRWRCWS